MDIRQLRYFMALIEQKNFAGAAERLSVSQQAVSKTLRDLEVQLGAKLFERGAHDVSPTEKGKKLAVHARAIFAQMRLAQAELNPGASERSGLVCVGFGTTVPERVITRTVNRYRQLFPKVGIRIHSKTTGELQRQVMDGSMHVFLSAPPADFPFASEVEVKKVTVERGQIMVRSEHPLAKRNKISLAALQGSPWIISSPRDAGWMKVCAVFARAGLSVPDNVVQVDSVPFGLGLIRSDNYVSVGDRNLYQSDLNRGHVKILDVPELELNRPVVLGISRARSRTSTIVGMVNCLKSAAESYNEFH